jgi:hypothetical protein
VLAEAEEGCVCKREEGGRSEVELGVSQFEEVRSAPPPMCSAA